MVDRTTAAVNFDLNSSTPSFWDFYSDIASHNAQRARDLGDKHASMYRRYLNRIADNGGGFFFANHAEIGAKTINFASSIASIFIDPSGFLNGVYEQGAKYNRAGGGGINGSILAVSGTLGLTGIAESIWGVDILTAEALNGDERFDRGMFGVSAAMTLAGSPGLSASGRSLLIQAGKMGPKINLVPPSLSTNFSKLSNRVAQTVGKWQNRGAPRGGAVNVAEDGVSLTGKPFVGRGIEDLTTREVWSARIRGGIDRARMAFGDVRVRNGVHELADGTILVNPNVASRMGTVTSGFSREVALYQRTNGNWYMRLGTKRSNTVQFKDLLDKGTIKTIIAHTHTSRNVYLGLDDVQLLNRLGASRHMVISGSGDVRRWFDVPVWGETAPYYFKY